MTRKPYVANKFYEGDPEELKKQIEKSFLGKFGPMEFPCKDSSERKIRAVIIPHAGYFFSGQCAAYAYKELAEVESDDVYLIIAPSHTGQGYTSITTENYETPFGEIDVEKNLANILIKHGIKDDITSHINEHSLEVQLPFLQYISDNSCKIVPLVIVGEINSKRLSLMISEAIKEYETKFNKTVRIIVSSDFTHYGKAYGYNPFHPSEALMKIEEQDMKSVEIIISLDSIKFNQFLEKTGATICGALPILTLIGVLKNLGKYEGELLSYYRSSQIVSDKDNAVSYCAIGFYEKTLEN